MATKTLKEESKQSTTKGKGFTWSFLLGLLGLMAFGLILSTIFGGQYSGRGAILAFFSSLMGIALGGISGFLFGFPRYTESTVVTSADDLRQAMTDENKSRRPTTGTDLRHNTNLERITDWLMTMVIGATLVNLGTLVEWSTSQFSAITAAITCCGPAISSGVTASAAPGALLVLPFMIAGFLHMYLWSRGYLLGDWRYLDGLADVRDKQIQQEEILAQLSSARYQVDPVRLKRFAETLKRFHFDQPTIDEVISRFRNAKSWDDDPFLNFGPKEDRGFRLSASTIIDDSDSSNPFRTDFSVERSDGQPFDGAVAALFHNSFETPFEVEPFSGPRYENLTWSAEAFALGVIVVYRVGESYETVRLSIDLEKLPNVPDGFIPKAQ